jgi:hypothetical protein
MRTIIDVEAYLGRMNRRFSTVDGQAGTLIVLPQEEKLPQIILQVTPPILVMRASVGKAPETDHVALYKKLLTLNAKTLVHTSFGLEDDQIVLTSALELENLDYNELEANLEEIEFTLVSQVPALSELSKKDG